MARWRVPIIITALFCSLAVLAGMYQKSNDFRFAILGDRNGSANAEVYEAVWKEIHVFRPEFVVNVGDSIQGGHDEMAGLEWAELHSLWERFPYRLYLVPGNHDIWSKASRKLWEKETGHPPFYSFDFQNAHFTVLDNSGGLMLDRSQLQFLEQDLKANTARSPKFVFFHQPFWLPFIKLGSGDFEFHRIARKYGVGFVFSGHGHQLVRGERDGITYVEVGSSGAGIGRGIYRGEGRAEGWFYHHVRATVKGNDVRLDVKELGGRTDPLDNWRN